MALTVGSRLGHYDVTALIGEGGMGQVYQATDTKLNRQVALKILPEAFATDPDRLARFQREAQVLASLNHPGIAAIYGLEESGDTRALVLELVEGPTLADRIAQGSIPVDEALPIAKQIAEALEAAHEAGVIHRDLKPANIKVREDGTVKVLDFGLAKAFQPDASDPGLSQSPTISLTAAATQMGVVLGTVAYMAPEQAKGKTVGKQADVWALGAVVYETLTGQKPFPGDDVSDVLATVLKTDPDWDALPTETPTPVRRMLRRCLKKERRERFHDAADARLEIEDALSATRDPAIGPVESGWSVRRWTLLGMAALLLVVLTSAVVLTLRRDGPSPRVQSRRFSVVVPPSDAVIGGSPLAFSPAGDTLVYSARRNGVDQIFHRSMNQLEVLPIAGTEGGRVPFVSPNGESVGFFDNAARLIKRVPLSGGAPITIASLEGGAVSADWGVDDTIVFSVTGPGPQVIWRVSAGSGEPEAFSRLRDGERAHFLPVFSPDAESVLYQVETESGDRMIVHQRVLTGERTDVMLGAKPVFATSGHVVVGRDNALWGVAFDHATGQAIGEPVRVLDSVSANAAGLTRFALAGDGTLAYVPIGGVAGEMVAARNRLVWVDREGQRTTVPESWDESHWDNHVSPRLTSDGRLVAVVIDDQIWIIDVERGTRTRLTNEGLNSGPVWSPSGDRVAFAHRSVASQGWHIAWRSIDATRGGEWMNDGSREPMAWSPNGLSIVYRERGDIWTQTLESEPSIARLTETPNVESAAVISPDGRWMAYVSRESGRFEVYARSMSGAAAAIAVSRDGGTEPVWSPMGDELLYRSGTQVVAVPVSLEPTLSLGPQRELFQGAFALQPIGLNTSANFSVSPQSDRLLMVENDPTGASGQIHVVLNWLQELQERVPVN